MTVTATQILDGIQRYIESEVVVKIPDARKWLVGAYVALMMRPFRENPSSLLNHPMIAPLGVATADGRVDIDAVHEVFLAQAQRGPSFINIPMVGPYNMDTSDIDKIYNYIISG